jgi:hypothetical protein
MKGAAVETFAVEILGVLKNTSPGRDIVLCRLSGLDLEKTGVIAGMSGSPVVIDGKLLGAISYAWPYGKDPIAGLTPLSQMIDFAGRLERRKPTDKPGDPVRVGLARPLTVGGQSFERVAVAEDGAATLPPSDDLVLRPLQTPVAAAGFSANALALLKERLGGLGMAPVQGGAAGAAAEREAAKPLEPGGSLAISLITGDFDLSGIGTVTYIDGDRVYGWGHPFMSMGDCDLPMMTGYIHTVFPRQTVSFKMGSPLRAVGVINADVSTCIAGRLGAAPDMLPVRTTVRRGDEAARTYNVKVVRQPSMTASLVFAALANAAEGEGELPEELTATFRARLELEGRPPVVIEDTYSGGNYSGSRTFATLYTQVANVVQMLTCNPYRPVHIVRVECDTTIAPGRRTAEIESLALAATTYAPGDTVQATVQLRPYKGTVRRLAVHLKLPDDVPDGEYHAVVCDDLSSAKQGVRDNPTLENPSDLEQLFQTLAVQTGVQRTQLVLRVPIPSSGLAVSGKALPNLPASMVQMLGNGRHTGALPVTTALVSRVPTEWVIQGSETAAFTVSRVKKPTHSGGE